MVNGITTSGFEFSVDEETVSDNMELVDALAELEDGDGLAMSRICRMILGKDQRKKLYDHLRTDKGVAPTSEVEKELMEIIDAINSGKK